MSHYDYHCKACDHCFELNVPIAKRDDACGEPCPECKADPETWTADEFETPVERLAAAPMFTFAGVGDSLKKNTPETFKDLLRNIKKNHLHSTIDV